MLYQITQKLPKTQAMGVIITGTFAAAYGMFAVFRYTGPDNGGAAPGEPKTTSSEWAAASVEYGKVQKANPIRHFRG